MTQLHELSALDQASAIQAGEVTSLEIANHYLERSEALGAEVGAFVRLLPQLARDQASQCDARTLAGRRPRSALDGVVCPVKDLSDIAHVPTSYGLKDVEIIPAADDNFVTALREAGLVFSGKTATPEFGFPCYTEPEGLPAARASWDRRYSAGGSSGGAAAAVAAGLAPIAHGSDGGGSIRIPCAVTGLVGIKPTRGRVSNGPLGDHIGDLATNGPIARTVADSAALLDIMSRPFVGDPHTAMPPRGGSFLAAARRSPRNLRLGYVVDPFLLPVPIDPAVISAVETVALLCEGAGHHVELTHSPFDDSLLAGFMVLWSTLAASIPLSAELEERLRPLTTYLRELGKEHTAADVATATTTLRVAARSAIAAWARFDVIIAPTLASPPALVGQLRNDSDPAQDFADQVQYSPYCAPINVTGLPAINVPAVWESDTIPIGIQLIGRMGEEETIISLAAQIEQAMPWPTRYLGVTE